jgi:hypothetical protein
MLSLVPDFVDLLIVYNIGVILVKNIYTDLCGFSILGCKE